MKPDSIDKPNGDMRKFNGGHSTRKKYGIDKRKNPYRQLVQDAITPKDVEKVLSMLVKKAVNKQDIKAAQLILEYTLGKPKQELDIKSEGNTTIELKNLVNFGNQSE